jgi:hypothetical protein
MQTLVLEQTALKHLPIKMLLLSPNTNHSLQCLLLNFLKSKFRVLFSFPSKMVHIPIT